jgi:hypothetical protein
MRFEDERDVVIHPTKLKPSLGDLQHSLMRLQRWSEQEAS